MAMLELRCLGKCFPGGVEAVAGVDLAVAEGEFLVVVGPSGSGKSTLLRLVAGLESPSAGEVWIGGRRADELSPRVRDVAMVFQEGALYPHLSVYENLAFGLRARAASRGEVAERVGSAAEMLGLEGLLDRRPAALSGGERRRVALGRALVRRPVIFLLDEPLSNLDGPLRLALRSDLAELHRRVGATMVLVTHDQVEAMALGDRVAVMRDGRIVQVGSPREVYEQPVDDFVAGFVGFLPTSLVPVRLLNEGSVLRVVPQGIEVAAAPCLRAGSTRRERLGKLSALVLGLRPEHVTLGADDSVSHADVSHCEWLGHELLVNLNWGGHTIRLLVTPNQRLEPGTRVPIRIDLERALFFEETSGRALV